MTARIFFFSNADYSDYRPVIQAASRAFLEKAALPAENGMICAFGLGLPHTPVLPDSIDLKKSWGETDWNIRFLGKHAGVRYISRPAHADQLHVEIWHKGYIACDAGTYLYNAPPRGITAVNNPCT